MKAEFFAPFIAAALLFTTAPASSFADDEVKEPDIVHTVTLLGFDGKVIDEITVIHGKPLDLSFFDTNSLNSYPDIYTQKGFSRWTPYPAQITEDIQVQALYRKMTLSYNEDPKKTEYFSKKGSILLAGLDVTISAETQVPVTQDDGSYKIELEKETIDLTENCTTSPSDLSEAFKNGAVSAEVTVYPILEEKPICSFRITYFEGLGDVNHDGTSDASDASAVLSIYSQLSTGKDPSITENDKLRCDVDRNGVIDSSDSSEILRYYSTMSTGTDNITWDDFFN